MSILTQQSIKKNRLTIAILLVIALLGITTFQSMPRSEDPGFIIRTASVATLFPGASPERVELLVTDKIEKVIKEIPELDFVDFQTVLLYSHSMQPILYKPHLQIAQNSAHERRVPTHY